MFQQVATLSLLIFLASISSQSSAFHKGSDSDSTNQPYDSESELYEDWLYCKYIDGNPYIRGDSTTYFSEVFGGSWLDTSTYGRGFANYLIDEYHISAYSFMSRCTWEDTRRDALQELRQAIRKAKARDRKKTIQTPWTPDL